MANLKRNLIRLNIRKINMSKKEKQLLLLLFTAVLIFIYFKFIITPQQQKLIQLKEMKEDYLSKLSKSDIVLSKEDSLKKQWMDLNTDFKKISENFYRKMEQSKILSQLNKIIDNNNLSVPGISFSGSDTVKIGDLDAENLKISLPFHGSYKELNEFLKDLRKNPEKLLVNQLSLSKSGEGILDGLITLETFAYGDFTDSKDSYFYDNTEEKVYKSDPFDNPFEIFDKNEILDRDLSDFDDVVKRIVIDDLKSNDIHFMSTSSSVTGSVGNFNKSKWGDTSKRLEYFISTNFKEERAYLVLDERDIAFKYPPDSIGIWAYSYGYSPVTIGFRFQDPDGNKIYSELAKGIGWIGWEYIPASPPRDINIYPLKLDRVYLELGANRDDYGVVLFDRIEAYFSDINEENEGEQGYIFYVVKPGDTLKSISEDIYGTQNKYKNIMWDNGLNESSEIKPGKVLVIRNR